MQLSAIFQVDLLLPIIGDPGAVCQGGGGDDFPLRPVPGSARMITVRTLPQATVLWYCTFCCAASILVTLRR